MRARTGVIDVADLRCVIADGRRPVIVIPQAGNVDTGRATT